MVTIKMIEDELYDLDTEYREALAHALMKYNLVSDSPLRLSLGSEQQQKELENVYNRELKANEIKQIINYISDDMKGDYQYSSFKRIAIPYIKIANTMEEELAIKVVKKDKPKCALIGQDGNIFNLMGIASKTLKRNNMYEESKEMIEKVTSSHSYDEALNIIGEYVEITDEAGLENEEEYE